MSEKKYSYLAIVVTMFVACATNEVGEQIERHDTDTQQISFVATPAASVLTRAEVDIQPNVFDADEVLQGYLWYDDHTANTDDGKSWKPLFTTMPPANDQNELRANTQLIWPADPTVGIRLYGLYPVTVTESTTEFTVQEDQTTDENYKASDLMWGGNHEGHTYLSAKYTNSNPAVNLPFKHKMVKLIVNAFSDGSVTGLTINGVTVNHIHRSIPFTPATGQLGTVSGTASEAIKMTNDGACLLPPQTVAKDTEFFEVSVTVDGEENVAKYKLANAITLEEGFQYTFALKVGAQALNLTSTIAGWTSSADTHTVTPQAFGSLMMEPVPAVTYKAAEYQVMPAVKDANGMQLTQGTHYDYSWYGNKDAGTAVVVATGKDDYEGQKAIQTFTINKALLTVTAEDKTKTYGEDNPALTVTYSGWQGSDNASNCLTNQPQVTTTATKESDATARDAADTNPVTPYPITASGAEAKNYDFSYVDGGLTVYKKTISDWSIDPTTMSLSTTGTKAGAITVSYGSGSSDDHGTVNWSSSATSVATVSAGTVTAVGGGSATIIVTIADGNNYIYSGSKTCAVTVKAAGVPLKDSQVGYKVCSDGLAYPADATLPSGVIVKGMVAYKNGNNGIVLAKSNVSGTYVWSDAKSYSASAGNFYETSTSSTVSENWICGLKDDYTNCGVDGNSTDWQILNTKLQAAGCDQLGSRTYWSSTGTGSNRAWSFSNGRWSIYDEPYKHYVRPLFAF